MPVTSGASHSIAAFATLIIGTVLSKFIWNLLPPLGQFSLYTIKTIRSITGTSIPANEQFAGTIVVMIGLSFTWGIIYHLRRHS